MTAVSETLCTSRSALYRSRQGNRPTMGCYQRGEDEVLLPVIKEITAVRPTYAYRRITILLKRRRAQQGKLPVNHKRVYR